MNEQFKIKICPVCQQEIPPTWSIVRHLSIIHEFTIDMIIEKIFDLIEKLKEKHNDT